MPGSGSSESTEDESDGSSAELIEETARPLKQANMLTFFQPKQKPKRRGRPKGSGKRRKGREPTQDKEDAADNPKPPLKSAKKATAMKTPHGKNPRTPCATDTLGTDEEAEEGVGVDAEINQLLQNAQACVVQLNSDLDLDLQQWV